MVKSSNYISSLKLVRVLFLNFFALSLLFCTAITIEYGTDFLVEFSLEIENEDTFELEVENEVEKENEKEKITHYQDFYIPNYGITAYFILKEDTSDFFEKIKSPPPEFS